MIVVTLKSTDDCSYEEVSRADNMRDAQTDLMWYAHKNKLTINGKCLENAAGEPVWIISTEETIND